MDKLQQVKAKLEEMKAKYNQERDEEDFPNHSDGNGMYWSGVFACLKEISFFVDHLKVKEVDLEKEYKDFLKCNDGRSMFETAKYFFELGLNASNPLTWEDMMIIHKCIKDAMNYHLYKMMEGMEGQKIVYEEVLKRFKEQKGEKYVK